MAPVFDPVAVILANWGQPAGGLSGRERPTEAIIHSMADGLPIDDLQILAYQKKRLAPSELINMETSDRLTQARKLAEEMHRGQTGKLGVPYIYHVLDVANRVKNLGEDIEIVGLLHDAVEDAHPDRPLTLDKIEVKFGKAVRDGVDGMTKRKGEEYCLEYLPRIMSNPMAKKVKIADSSHNISKAHLIPETKEQENLRNKYAAALVVLGVDPIQAEVPLVFSEGPDFTGWTEKLQGQTN